MTIYVSIDDTDSLESRGTGKLAREIAKVFSSRWRVFGITRHQLYVHDDIPFTSHNSCAVIHVDASGLETVNTLFEVAEEIMMQDFIPGSDPGLSVAEEDQITSALIAFGMDAKTSILTQEMARNLAKNLSIRLKGLGGTEDGVIGSMAGLGLAATHSDGRFLLVGNVREYTGEVTVEQLLSAGVDTVQTTDGVTLTTGTIVCEDNKSVKPSLLGGKITVLVTFQDGIFYPIKRN